MLKLTLMETQSTEENDGLHIVTEERDVEKRHDVGKEGRVTCKVMDEGTLIAEFNGATALQRAEECLKLARSQKRRGIPITPQGKCVADGARIKAKPTGPMLPWGGIESRQ